MSCYALLLSNTIFLSQVHPEGKYVVDLDKGIEMSQVSSLQTLLVWPILSYKSDEVSLILCV